MDGSVSIESALSPRRLKATLQDSASRQLEAPRLDEPNGLKWNRVPEAHYQHCEKSAS